MLISKRLYTVKRYFWFVFSTKEVAMAVAGNRTVPALTEEMAELWSKELGSSVSFLKPGDSFTVTEVDGVFVNVAGNETGWVVADMSRDWTVRALVENKS